MTEFRYLRAAPCDTEQDFDVALIRTHAPMLTSDALREAQVDLAHVERITTIRRLTASGVTSLNPSSRFASDGNGFQVLWEDSERVFCRGDSHGDSTRVLAVLPASGQPTPAVLDRLAHEYELRDELDGAWAARPLELVRERGRTMLMLEDPGGEPLERLLGAPLETGHFLRLAIDITVALAKLHLRGLLHKDVKPANIIVNCADRQVRLTGFGIASRVPRERQAPEPPESIAGTLAYMAPEQTGRMNRSIDSRSDLYALGVTFYQMLSGSLPFIAADPMEWVHCHIARKPLPPSERSENIPAPVSEIIMKLLAKTAEERYQTAVGVESDLRRCLVEWERKGHIEPFALGEHDAPDRLLLPEKLYGRAREVKTLLACFDRMVNNGAVELVLVSGYSGIGKSSVVNELHRVLVQPRGLFASGKFDQYKRDIPYSTLAQAFQSLIRPLLGKSDAELAGWREAFREALGPNGRLIIDLVPELKHIVGDQPPVPELPPRDAQRRFQLVFRRVLAVFARPEHPLALFLDDLQWLDSATLDLLEDLLTQPDVQHLMLIGAYRDNEVNSAHPLICKLEAIRKAGAVVHEIILAPLASEDVGRLIGDALHCEPGRVTALAELIHEKTAGNPFFINQLISVLGEEGLLTFDYGEGRWSWDLNSIRAKGYTDNVADLMIGKLNRLPVETRHALQLLACMGNSAVFALLQIASQQSAEKIHDHLWEAIRAGLIFRTEQSYTFAHDRVQEAAYSLIPEEARAAAHLRIGRLLLTSIAPEERHDAIFEIVNQLNRGASLVTSQEEREKLAELNLIAGKRAKASSAHASALTYFTAGAALLPEDAWERRQELAFALQLYSADCEMCTGALQAAEQRLATLATRAAGTVQRCDVAQQRADLYAMLGTSERAVVVGLECLRHIGIDWPARPTDEEARSEYERFWSLLGSRAIEDLIDLPQMQDAEALATINLLTSLSTPAFFADPNLGLLMVYRAANLNLEGGNSDAAPVNYSALGQMASGLFGRYHEGYRLGKMACDLLERRPLIHFGARTYYYFANVVPWTRPFREAIDPARRAFQIAKERGDPAFAAYSFRALSSIFLASGHPLDQVERELERGMEFVRRFGFFIDRISASLALVRMLRGTTAKFGSLDDGRFTERSFEERAKGADAFLEHHYLVRKLQARFLAGDYASAIDAADKLDTLYARTASLSVLMLGKGEYHFHAALSRAASCEPMGPDPYTKHRTALEKHERELRAWAANCPQNFEDRAALVGAEIARVEGRSLDAMDLYERAIASARANDFVHNEALAYELAARFYAERGFKQIADLYLRNARYCYLRWGANGKVRQLDETYPDLRQDEAHAGPTSTIGAPVEQLDLATVIKVSQAVSGEIALESLIDTLMRTAMEQAGAERALLIMPSVQEPRIEAEATTSGDR
jgi:predicted ATPase